MDFELNGHDAQPEVEDGELYSVSVQSDAVTEETVNVPITKSMSVGPIDTVKLL